MGEYHGFISGPPSCIINLSDMRYTRCTINLYIVLFVHLFNHRKSPRFRAEGERSADEHTGRFALNMLFDKLQTAVLLVCCLLKMNPLLSSDEVESTPTSRSLRRREEDSTVRRSSRITRYKLDARNQSVLYDRLITKYALILTNLSHI